MTARYLEAVWAVIPARGGSRTIPMKNMVPLNGRPLIDYVITAARATAAISRVVCSTEHDAIAEFCRARDVEVRRRPDALALDNVPSVDVVLDVLASIQRTGEPLAEIVVLLEPTSPFVLPAHIEGCVSLLKGDPSADSAQTITPVGPNSHAYNQRRLRDGAVEFVCPEERARYPNKQLKPAFYVHGNVRVVRSRCLLEKRDLFGGRSLPVVISRLHALDVDGPEDLTMAECLLQGRAVWLPE